MGRGDQDRRRVYGSIVLDSQGLSRAETDRSLAVTLTAASRTGTPIVVSAITLTEVLRGHERDASVHRALKACQVRPVTAEVGRAAGELLGRTGRKDTIDAVVAVTAFAQPAPVLLVASDPDDLAALTAGSPGVRLRAV